MKLFVLFIIMALTPVLAQAYPGSYTSKTDPNTVLTISFENGNYYGSLIDSVNGEYKLQGIIQEEYLEGFLTPTNPDYQKLIFVISVENDSLTLLAALTDENNQPIKDSAQSFEFVRATANTTTASQPNPLSTQTTVTQNPLAATQTRDLYSGSYKGSSFDLNLRLENGMYVGSIVMNGQTFPLRAEQQGNELNGQFSANGQTFSFKASIKATQLTLISDGQTYLLEKQMGGAQVGSSPAPLAQNQTTTQANQAGVPIELNKQYPAGTRLYSQATGLSFVVPQNYVAFYDRDFQGFLMKALDNSNLMLIEAVSTGTAEDLGFYAIESLAAFISPKDPRFQVIQGPAYQGNTLLASFAIADGTTLSGAAKSGETGNAAVVISYGQDLNLVNQVAENFSFSRPQADIATMQQQLFGLHLFHDQSSDKYISAPLYSSSTTVAGNSKFSYDFCSNGRFQHDFDNLSYISVSDSSGGLGMIAETGDKGRKQGQWQIVSLLMGNPLLVMTTDDAEFLLKMLEKTNNGFYLDGVAFQVSQSEICR